MPLAQITIMEGRDSQMKASLIREVTEAISKSISAPKERIRVVIYEVPKSNWGIAGDTAESLGR